MGEDPVPEHLRPLIAEVVSRIAAQDYAGLKQDGIDPSPDSNLSMWIRNNGEIGVRVRALPEEAWEIADANQTATDPPTWSVVVPLWTV